MLYTNIFKILLAGFILLGLWTCGSTQEENLPESEEATQERIREKRAKLRELTADIDNLEAHLYTLNPELRPAATPVTLLDLEAGSFQTFAELQGTLVAEETAMATSEVGGRITSLRVDEGDVVRRGQLIANIDVQAFNNQKTELETQLNLARTVYERQERLWNQNIGSELQYLEAKNRVESLQDALNSLQTQINKQNVYAPISGAVERVMLRTGELASPGMPIVSILSTNKLIVSADVPESMIGMVKQRDQLTVKIPNLSLDFQGQVSRIGSTVDAANRTFEIEIKVPANLVRQLKPNMLALVEMNDTEFKDVIAIPNSLLQQEVNGSSFVFVATDNEEGQTVAEKRYVTPGESYDGQVIIEDGLDNDDRLIDRGARGLVNGQPVSITTLDITNADSTDE